VFASSIPSNADSSSVFRGALVSANWAEIEPSPGIFDFTSIDAQLARLPAGAEWSLAVHGGWTSVDETDPDLYDGSTYPDGSPRPVIALSMSPAWLVTTYHAETFAMPFRDVTVNMPEYWDPTIQDRLRILADGLDQYLLTKRNIRLVYIPQMTSNGLEGHFNGVSQDVLVRAAGIDPSAPDAADQFEDIWVDASLTVSRIFAAKLTDKALAFEVHDVIGRASIPIRIMDGFLTDRAFEDRVGVAMWWLSGNTDYQSELIDHLRTYEGDIYGQIIGRSDQPERFPNNDFTAVFQQGEDLCIRYIEAWPYEFENHTYDAEFTDYNTFTDSVFDR
jgi:hypothetical protein